MLHWKIEGYRTKPGLNFYKPSDPGSAGFIIRAMGREVFRFRYSKITGVLHINNFRLPHSRRLPGQTR